MAMWMVMGSANRCPQGRFAGPEGSTKAPPTALLRPAAARAAGTGSSGGAPQRRSEAATGQAGGSGGAHERHSPSAVKQDTPRTLPHACGMLAPSQEEKRACILIWKGGLIWDVGSVPRGEACMYAFGICCILPY